MPARTPPPISVEAVDGPEAPPFLIGESTYITVGRSSECGVNLEHHAVSRQHMAVLARDGAWFVMDTGSRNGTRLNGLALPKGEPTPLADADHLQVGPWTFRVRIGVPGTALAAATIDDMASSGPRLRTTGVVEPEAGLRLQVASLLKASAILHSAPSEQDMLTLLLDAALSATGFERAAVLRRTPRPDQVEVVCQRVSGTPASPVSSLVPFSRSLLRAAAEGPYAVVNESAGIEKPETLIRFDIAGAACAPIKLAEAPWGFLYLDSGAGTPPTSTGHVLEIVRGLADIASMALASIKQREVQRRLDALHEDLAAAGEIQRFLMPPDRGTVGGVNYAVWSRPGRMVSGDLFSITDCGDGRVAFFLGDVMGKGLGAGLIMSGVISFLHCMLRNTSDPAEALSRLNDYLCPRLIDGRFVSLWLGIIDAKHGVLTAADAGHGYALIVPPGAVPTRLECSGGTPIAAADHCRYTNTTLAFEQGSRLVLYSDGIVEQRSPANEPFGTDRLSRSIDGSSSSGDDVTRISRAVEAFIGGAAASDDLTVASIALRA